MSIPYKPYPIDRDKFIRYQVREYMRQYGIDLPDPYDETPQE